MNPNEAAARWVVSRLRAAGITEPIDRGGTPEGAEYPRIILQPQGGPQRYVVGTAPATLRVTLLVRSVDESWDTVRVSDLESKVHAALSDVPAYEGASGYTLLVVYRDSFFEKNVIYQSRMYRSLGGYYVFELE